MKKELQLMWINRERVFVDGIKYMLAAGVTGFYLFACIIVAETIRDTISSISSGGVDEVKWLVLLLAAVLLALAAAIFLYMAIMVYFARLYEKFRVLLGLSGGWKKPGDE